jgi:hypothetical protein
MRSLRNPAVHPIPALLLLLLALGLRWASGPSPETPGVQREGLLPLACWLTLTGVASYWLTLVLSRAGLLHGRGGFAMRTPTGAELQVAELLLRAVSLLVAYGAPLLLWWA